MRNSAPGSKPASPDKSSFKSSELDCGSCQDWDDEELKSADDDIESPVRSPSSALLRKAFARRREFNAHSLSDMRPVSTLRYVESTFSD